MQERRRYVRWPINIPTTYRLENLQDEFSCLAKDISLRGMGIDFAEKIDHSHVILINIPIKDANPINLKAEVMWQAEDEHSGLYKTGLYFTNLKEDDREKILQLAGK